MSEGHDFGHARMVVIGAAVAQALFWLWTLQVLRNGLLPFDLVFFWLTVPTFFLGLLGHSIPLAAGLAAASLTINFGLILTVLGAA